MKRIILFSTPTENNRPLIFKKLFPKELKPIKFAYMPAEGIQEADKWIQLWQQYTKPFVDKFLLIDNCAKNPAAEIKKLEAANVLFITGGNTFKLLANLRKSKLDKAIINFAKKENFVIAGFSAGALILTPSIDIAGLDLYYGHDQNIVNIKNTNGLNLVDFEVAPHFKYGIDEAALTKYSKHKATEIKTISDDEYILVDY